MKTVKDWIDFLGDNENYVFGLRLKNGLSCPRRHYFPKTQALEIFKGYLDEIVIDAFPMNFREDDKIGALLIYEYKGE